MSDSQFDSIDLDDNQTIYEIPDLGEDKVAVFMFGDQYSNKEVDQMKEELAKGNVNYIAVKEGTGLLVADKDQVFLGAEGNIYLKEEEEIRELLGLENKNQKEEDSHVE